MDSPKPALDDLRIRRLDQPKSNPLGLITIVVCMLVIGAIVLWWFTRPKAIEVHTAAVREVTSNGGGERTVLNASGYVTARRAATASSKVTGKVMEVLIEEGLKVKEGQVLARLDDTNVKANLNVAQAQLESAKQGVGETDAQLKQAELEFKRATDLNRQKIASQSELDSAEANAKALRARLARQ